MKKIFFAALFILISLCQNFYCQIPLPTLIKIVRAEDERRYDLTLENLLKDANPEIRKRAALAAGRIGNEKAIPALIVLMNDTSSPQVQNMAMFALGEIESLKALKEILLGAADIRKTHLRARSLEAIGKIAAANSKDSLSVGLGNTLIEILKIENTRRSKANEEIILAGITAVLRARPEGGDKIIGEFLNHENSRIRADSLNTLARLRTKNFNETARKLLETDKDPIVRANAARLLGTGEDKTAIDLLLNAATKDTDSRVRVSAIRSLGNLKEPIAADTLLKRAEIVLANYKNSKLSVPNEKSELLEIATVLGNLLKGSDSEKAISFLKTFRNSDKFLSPETETALAKISPNNYGNTVIAPLSEVLTENIKAGKKQNIHWRIVSNVAQAVSELSNLEKNSEKAREQSLKFLNIILQNPYYVNYLEKAVPDVIRAYAKFKTNDLPAILKKFNSHNDVIVRATAVELLGEIPSQDVKFSDIDNFLRPALEDDKSDDALLALIGAVEKQKSERATDFLQAILEAISLSKPKYHYTKYPARRRIISILKERGVENFPSKFGEVDSIFGNADYMRAVSRRNGSVKAVLTTEKGRFTINFFPEDAPLTVDNFVKLARAKYFDGLEVHRVVPNFVMQDGDPRGDGSGGPGWSIRCEINMLSYERGAVGMALSGKDTGGSQWFVTHSPQTHLDGGYTVFGRVNETDMEVVDKIVRGDKILSVRILENNLPPNKRVKKMR